LIPLIKYLNNIMQKMKFFF